VELTPEGEAVFQAESVAYERVAAAMLAPLTEAERKALLDLLARVGEAVEAEGV
jgi:DNA-binding MarR family transcriptional regulator